MAAHRAPVDYLTGHCDAAFSSYRHAQRQSGEAAIVMPEREAPQANWPMVFACFCTGVVAWGLGFYGPGIYLAELQRLHHWPSGLISAATTTYYLASAALLPLVHNAVARLGPRAVLGGGAMILALGVSLIARVEAPWQLFAAYLVVSIGWVCTSSVAISTVVALWFDRRRGLAVSLALNGASVAGFTVAPLMVYLNHRHDFPQVTTAVAGTAVAILLPIVMVCVRGPRGGDARPATTTAAAVPKAGNRREVMRTPAFWTLTVPYALGLMAQVGYFVHQIAFLLPGLGAEGAGLAVGLGSIAAMSGRLGYGIVADRLNHRLTGAILLTNQAAAILLMILLPREPGALWLGSLMFGLSVGALITLPTLIVQQEFPPGAFSMTIGLVSALSQVTYAFGPALVGVVRDLAGGYGPALSLCIAWQLAGAAILATGRRQRR